MPPRPHKVTVYRRQSGAGGSYREKTSGWTEVASGVRGDIQPRARPADGVDQRPYGRTGEEGRVAFFPTGTDIRRHDGLLVTEGTPEGTGPTHFLVTAAHDWGAPGDLELELEETAESFT